MGQLSNVHASIAIATLYNYIHMHVYYMQHDVKVVAIFNPQSHNY